MAGFRTGDANFAEGGQPYSKMPGRTISNRGSVLIRGNKVPIVGTICMDLTMCDITGINDVRPGEEAVFLGSQGQETIVGDDIAGWAGTIPYEILCSVGQRNKREYIS